MISPCLDQYVVLVLISELVEKLPNVFARLHEQFWALQARAAGVRCGDGVGAGGRKHIQHLIDMEAVSVEECMKKCPTLQIRPMRTTRYRQVTHTQWLDTPLLSAHVDISTGIVG